MCAYHAVHGSGPSNQEALFNARPSGSAAVIVIVATPPWPQPEGVNRLSEILAVTDEGSDDSAAKTSSSPSGSVKCSARSAAAVFVHLDAYAGQRRLPPAVDGSAPSPQRLGPRSIPPDPPLSPQSRKSPFATPRTVNRSSLTLAVATDSSNDTTGERERVPRPRPRSNATATRTLRHPLPTRCPASCPSPPAPGSAPSPGRLPWAARSPGSDAVTRHRHCLLVGSSNIQGRSRKYSISLYYSQLSYTYSPLVFLPRSLTSDPDPTYYEVMDDVTNTPAPTRRTKPKGRHPPQAAVGCLRAFRTCREALRRQWTLPLRSAERCTQLGAAPRHSRPPPRLRTRQRRARVAGPRPAKRRGPTASSPARAAIRLPSGDGHGASRASPRRRGAS